WGDLVEDTAARGADRAFVSHLSQELASRTVVLDGELVARQGRPWDFYGLGARLGAQSSVAAARGRARTPVTFAAFDALVLEGERQTRVAHEAVTAHVLRGGFLPVDRRPPPVSLGTGGDPQVPSVRAH